MSVLFEDNEVSVFSAECSLTYSSFIYCMMLNRLSRGYSAQELSFLLGQDDDFVADLERFERFDMGVELYQQLSKVFGHSSFIHQQHSGERKMQHEMHIWKAGDTIFYRMECCKNEFESITLFQVNEEDPEVGKDRFSNSVKSFQKRSQDALNEMLVEGYFNKPIEAYEIHKICEHLASGWIDPVHIKSELQKLVGRKGTAPLKKTKRRSYGYRYVLHPGTDAIEALVFAQEKFDK